MENKNQDQFVEELLDAGLARYSNVTPRPGLEGRVLASVRAEKDRRAWFVWPGVLAAGAVAAAIVLGVVVLRHSRTGTPQRAVAYGNGGSLGLPIPDRAGARPAPTPTMFRRPLLARPAAHRSAITAAAEPRLVMFPSPRPLTEQEKLLLEYVRRTPVQALAAAAPSHDDIQDEGIKVIDVAPQDAEETRTKAR